MTHMLDGCGHSEVTVFVTVSAESTEQITLIVITEYSSSGTIKSKICAVVKSGTIYKLGRSGIDTDIGPVIVADDINITVSDQDIITERVKSSDRIKVSDRKLIRIKVG